MEEAANTRNDESVLEGAFGNDWVRRFPAYAAHWWPDSPGLIPLPKVQIRRSFPGLIQVIEEYFFCLGISVFVQT